MHLSRINYFDIGFWCSPSSVSFNHCAAWTCENHVKQPLWIVENANRQKLRIRLAQFCLPKRRIRNSRQIKSLRQKLFSSQLHNIGFFYNLLWACGAWMEKLLKCFNKRVIHSVSSDRAKRRSGELMTAQNAISTLEMECYYKRWWARSIWAMNILIRDDFFSEFT